MMYPRWLVEQKIFLLLSSAAGGGDFITSRIAGEGGNITGAMVDHARWIRAAIFLGFSSEEKCGNTSDHDPLFFRIPLIAMIHLPQSTPLHSAKRQLTNH
eukprot:scaffold314_cov197-Skeletonema_marinoi.AAC.2